MVALLAVALLAGPVGAAAVGGSSPGDHPTRGATAELTGDSVAVSTDAPDLVDTTFEVRLRDDGDARWVVTTRYRLADETDREAFRDYGRRFVDGDAEPAVAVDTRTFERAAEGASAVAGRSMNVTDVSRGYDLENESVGALRLTFTWTNFLGTGRAGLVLRDALLRETPGGETDTWLERLGPRQTLVVRTPPGYSLRSQPGVPYRNNSLVVEGPYEFDAGEPFIVSYDRVSDPGGSENTPEPAGGLPLAAVGGVLVAAAVLVGVFAFRRGSRVGEGGPAATTGTDPGDGATESASEPVGDESEPEADDDAGDERAPTEPESAVEPEPELLSDGERVERLLSDNDGRMRQADIVDETGWSDAKVSQLLSEMADDGRVEKLRIGRENLISLAGDEGDGEA